MSLPKAQLWKFQCITLNVILKVHCGHLMVGFSEGSLQLRVRNHITSEAVKCWRRRIWVSGVPFLSFYPWPLIKILLGLRPLLLGLVVFHRATITRKQRGRTNHRALFPLSWFFSANQRFCWAHADSFLTLRLLSMPKPLIFWAHADTPKSQWEHCHRVRVRAGVSGTTFTVKRVFEQV